MVKKLNSSAFEKLRLEKKELENKLLERHKNWILFFQLNRLCSLTH